MKRIIKAISSIAVLCTVIGLICSLTEGISNKYGWSKKHNPVGIYEKIFKRMFDVALSSFALLLLFPLMATIAIMVKTNLGSPVIFKQERPGLDEKTFVLYKFRTMTDSRDKEGRLLSDEERLTRLGRWMRRTSLDELPELINIIKGDMSIVGPRPLLIRYLPFYSKREHRRHDVRPGLTGYAQVNGRNCLNWDDRLSMDVDYVNNITFLGDLRIVLKTLKTVICQDGAASNSFDIEIYLDDERAGKGKKDE